MATESSVEIKGLAELDKLLKELPAKIEGNVIRGALRAGQKTMMDAVKAKLSENSSIKTKALERSIRIRFNRKSAKRGWINSYLIAGNAEAYYSHWVEYGTAAHFISVKKEAAPSRMTRRGIKSYGIGTINKMVKRGSLVIGKNFVGQSVAHPGARPKPFMRPAFDANSDKSIESMVEYMKKRIPKEIKKAGL